MSAILSLKNSVNNLTNLVNDINGSNNAYYMFVGKSTPWLDANGTNIDTNPPDANLSIQATELDIYNNISFGKLIKNINISTLILNNPWTNNTIYNSYKTGDSSFYINNYIVTDVMNVYKCIDNNKNLPSTIKPSITPTSGSFQTGDGYVWKYMYTIAASDFSTNVFVPLTPNTFVSNNAVPGTIDLIRINNGGVNWQSYHRGYIQSLMNQESIIIAANAIGIDNFYTGSSVYLKSGLGTDQVRKIVSYDGSNKIATVYPPFQTYATLQLDNASISGTILLNQYIYQNYANIQFLYHWGVINKNDTLIQTETNVSGVVTSSNSSFLSLNQLSNSSAIVTGLPFYNATPGFATLTGTLTINSGANTIIGGVTANLLTIPIGSYIQVGNVNYKNIRRITSITNSSFGRVATNFNNTLIANVFSTCGAAIEPLNIAVSNNAGKITQLNLGSMEILYGNTSTNAIPYILGETVKEYDITNIDQSCNAVVSFANSSTLILSNISGVLNIGNFLIGQSSSLKSQITNIITYPTVTLSNVIGSFLVGQPVFAAYGNNSTSGSANLLSYSFIPAQQTEYIISPTINIQGDGTNAIAYSVVNTQVGSNFPISQIIMINNGKNYTFSNVTITSNSLYGQNAVLEPVVSPIYGHGYNPAEELGGKYLGISVTFDTALSENYYFPNYGSYRQIGIIKSPLYNDLYVNHTSPKRLNLSIQNIQNGFIIDELIFQYSTQAAGLIKFANSTLVQIDQINGTFTSNSAQTGVNNMIIGLKSNSLANVISTNSINFTIVANNQLIYQTNTNVNGIIKNVVNSTMIQLSNVNGKFLDNTTIYDSISNAYANVVNLYVANSQQLTTTFGQKFKQLSRITIYSNTSQFFINNELITQDTTTANAVVLDTTHELDLSINNVSGSISTGVLLTNSNTNANGIILFANNSYIKLTGIQGNFNLGDRIVCLTGNATVSNVYHVVVTNNLENNIPFQYNYNIRGNQSNAVGYPSFANTITYPDLVKNSGEVIYLNNLKPFTLGLNTKEVFFTVIEF
jgi:hypothetical protein